MVLQVFCLLYDFFSMYLLYYLFYTLTSFYHLLSKPLCLFCTFASLLLIVPCLDTRDWEETTLFAHTDYFPCLYPTQPLSWSTLFFPPDSWNLSDKWLQSCNCYQHSIILLSPCSLGHVSFRICPEFSSYLYLPSMQHSTYFISSMVEHCIFYSTTPIALSLLLSPNNPSSTAFHFPSLLFPLLNNKYPCNTQEEWFWTLRNCPSHAGMPNRLTHFITGFHPSIWPLCLPSLSF